MKLRRIKASSSELSSFLEANYEDMKQYEGQVQEIAQRVREKGNQAIFEYNQKFDGALINEDNFMVNEAEFEAAYDLVDDEFIFALRAAIDNIEVFHARQLRNSWMEADERGCILGQVFRPLERVGISLLIMGIKTWVSGSPNRALNSSTLGPASVIISPA
jgi:histidinol dehydrogenase